MIELEEEEGGGGKQKKMDENILNTPCSVVTTVTTVTPGESGGIRRSSDEFSGKDLANFSFQGEDMTMKKKGKKVNNEIDCVTPPIHHEQRGDRIQFAEEDCVASKRFSIVCSGKQFHVKVFGCDVTGDLYLDFYDIAASRSIFTAKLPGHSRSSLCNKVWPTFRETLKNLAVEKLNQYLRNKVATPHIPRRAPPPAPESIFKGRQDYEEEELLLGQDEREKLIQEQREKIATLELALEKASSVKEPQDLNEDLLAEIELLKMRLSEKERAIDSLTEERNEELEALMSESENVVDELKTSLNRSEARCNILKTQIESVRDQLIMAEENVSKAEDRAEESRLELRNMQLHLEERENEWSNAQVEAEAVVRDLEDRLDVMTTSKNQNKEYGAKMKSKLVDLQSAFSGQMEELTAANQTLESENRNLKEKIAELECNIVAKDQVIESSQAENSSLNAEVVHLGDECDQLKQAKSNLEENFRHLQDELAQTSEERDALNLERNERFMEFEDQLKNQKIHNEEINKNLKIQIFDANASLAEKIKEVEELTGYVQNLLDQQDALDVCETCRTKINQASAM